jgi:hypothetical protein
MCGCISSIDESSSLSSCVICIPFRVSGATEADISAKEFNDAFNPTAVCSVDIEQNKHN